MKIYVLTDIQASRKIEQGKEPSRVQQPVEGNDVYQVPCQVIQEKKNVSRQMTILFSYQCSFRTHCVPCLSVCVFVQACVLAFRLCSYWTLVS